MISATDSFVKYLETELAGNPSVAWVRKTATNDTAHLFQHNKLNISVLMFSERGTEETALVSLDLICAEERQAWVWAKLIRDKLIEQQYTPELDYSTNPISPTSLGRYVSWDGRDIHFELVNTDEHNVHLNATFQLCHVRQ